MSRATKQEDTMTATTNAAPLGPGRNRRQVCASLGCSRSYFYVLLDNGAFPNAYFLGGSVRVPQSDVDEYRTRNLYLKKKG
ncbi:MAG: hypothetical protein C0405_14335 [Desulfovibrio sp.]|nr:hypothetical protein [Desulfovibrio sp.]